MIEYKEFKERYQKIIVSEYSQKGFDLNVLTMRIAKELKEKDLKEVKRYIECARQSDKSWLRQQE